MTVDAPAGTSDSPYWLSSWTHPVRTLTRVTASSPTDAAN